jgi:hypothetical protein
MRNLRVPKHVRYQSQDHGGVVILDTAGGKWLALNATAGEFWRAWAAGRGFEEGLRAVAVRYPQVPHGALRTDAERLMDELLHRGLLTDGPAPVPFPPPEAAGSTVGSADRATGTVGGAALMAGTMAPAELPRPGRGRAGLALCVLIVTCLIVRCSSFRVQLALVHASRRWCRRDAALGEAAATVATVDWAARRYPGRAACLEQSLTAVLLAAAVRHRLDWCLGAVADPYRFHAWVEAQGRPVPTRDDPPSPLSYSRLLSA